MSFLSAPSLGQAIQKGAQAFSGGTESKGYVGLAPNNSHLET